jgi:hypothetical protein
MGVVSAKNVILGIILHRFCQLLLKGTLLPNTYLSFGYSIYAPRLMNSGRESNLNPFDPLYAQLYFDIDFIDQ